VCPNGQTCQLVGGMYTCTDGPGTGPDARTIDGPADDVDGDGILNAVDDCPTVYDPAQDNEDGDRFGDVCDPCPIVADADPVADADGDGVSDPCDPHMTTPGDKIVLFEGFDHGTPANTLDSGMWTFAGGDSTLTSAASAIDTLTWPTTAAGSEMIATKLTIDQMFGTGVPRGAGPILEMDAGGRGITCEPTINAMDVASIGLIDTGPGLPLASDTTVPVAVGDSYEITLVRNGTAYTCSSDHLAMPLTGTSSLAPAGARRGLRGRATSAHFNWILVVEGP
jgi:hypothetical protein